MLFRGVKTKQNSNKFIQDTFFRLMIEFYFRALEELNPTMKFPNDNQVRIIRKKAYQKAQELYNVIIEDDEA